MFFLPSLTYCLFMLNCFNKDNGNFIDRITCPKECECYTASSNGVSGDDASSYICSNIFPLLLEHFFKLQQINTVVLKSGEWHKLEYAITLKTLPALSVVFKNFNMTPNSHNYNTIFVKFNPEYLQYITIVDSDLFGTGSGFTFEWSVLQKFQNLKGLYIENSNVQHLNESFRLISPKLLNSITINNSRLGLIGKWTFCNRKNTLRKLILSSNQITNVNWLQSPNEPYNTLTHLDLSNNLLFDLPEDLHISIPNVSLLYLFGNQFKYFTYQSVAPWFGINEFWLLSHKDYPLYWTKKMKWLLKLNKYEIQANFLVESFVEHIYRRAHDNDSDFCKWQILTDSNYLPYSNPNKVSLNYALNKAHDESDGQNNFHQIFGTNILDSIIYWPMNDDTKRFLLRNSLSKLKPKQYVRFFVFDKRHVQYLQGQITLSPNEINNDIQQICDLLEEIYQFNLRAFVVLWNSKDFQSLQIFDSESDNEHWNRFKETFLLPLLERIKLIPSLVGFEVIENAFSSTLKNFKEEPNPNIEDCPYDDQVLTKSVRREMRFLIKFNELLKEHGNEQLISFSFQSSCIPCFIIATVPNCLKLRPFDLFTIISNIKPTQIFDYGNSQYNDKWFHLSSQQIKKSFLYLFTEKYSNDHFDDNLLGFLQSIYIANL